MIDNSKIQNKNKSEDSPPLEDLLAEIEATTIKPGVSNPADLSGDKPELLRYSSEQYIRFTIDKVNFAVPLNNSLEVGRLPEITPLPNLPLWVLGISNIRGEVVSMVDLKIFFGLELSSETPGENMVLLHNGKMKVGFQVDRLLGILFLAGEKSKVTSNPFTEGHITPYLKGVITAEESLIYLLDVEKLLSSKEMNAFN